MRLISWNIDSLNAALTSDSPRAQLTRSVLNTIKKQDAAAENSLNDLLKYTKTEVERLMKIWDKINDVDYPFAQYKLLYLLSDKKNDDEGKKLADKFKKFIDDKFPDSGKEYNKKAEQIKDSDVINDENKGEDEKPKKQNPEEATTETIQDNADVLTPIVKTLGGKVDGNKLKDTVTKLLSKTQKTSPMKLKQNNILGMSVMICGALMMSSDKGLKAVCNELETDAKAFTDAIKPDEIKTGENKK